MSYSSPNPARRRGAVTGLLALVLLLAPPVVHAQRTAVLQPSGRWVTDQADMLSDSDEERLTRTLSTYAKETSTQIIIVTVSNLNGAEIADYAIELGRVWKVGQEEHDNGAVILVAKDERKVFIATGYGLEGVIPDALAGRIVRQIITPRFKQGNFYEGLAGAVDAMTAAASGEYQAEQILDQSSNRDRRGKIVFAIVLLIWLLILIMIIRSRMRRGDDDSDHGSDSNDGAGRRRRRRRSGWFSGPNAIVWGSGGGWGHSSGSSSGGFSSGGFSGGGFSGGGGSFGGGGAGGSW